MAHTARRAKRLAAVVWFLSWFELYLEIYRHHHVSPSFLVTGRLSPRGMPADAHAGGWLRSVLIASAVAPLVFLILLVWEQQSRRRQPNSAPPANGEPFPLASAAIAFGLLLALSGTLNQVIRHPAMGVDLTLRTGNGGFILLGGALVVTGWLITRRARC